MTATRLCAFVSPQPDQTMVTINCQLAVGIGFGTYGSVGLLAYIRDGVQQAIEAFAPDFDVTSGCN
jgi:hypothetical protein